MFSFPSGLRGQLFFTIILIGLFSIDTCLPQNYAQTLGGAIHLIHQQKDPAASGLCVVRTQNEDSCHPFFFYICLLDGSVGSTHEKECVNNHHCI